jgi:hypothetical protein
MGKPRASIKPALSSLRGVETLPDKGTQARVALVLGEVDRLDALLSESWITVRPSKLSTRRDDRARASVHRAGVARSRANLRLRPGCGDVGSGIRCRAARGPRPPDPRGVVGIPSVAVVQRNVKLLAATRRPSAAPVCAEGGRFAIRRPASVLDPASRSRRRACISRRESPYRHEELYSNVWFLHSIDSHL